PRPAADLKLRIAKLSKRFDSDISAVCAAFALQVEAGQVSFARIAFGGMAATPKRARAAEAALLGQPWCEASVEAACAALATDYQPLNDVRGSAAYRLAAAANLLRRLWVEEAHPGAALSVLDPALVEAHHG
ncbi:MAG TPA: xanthine dehydrogenase small subunit, partial [Novosphingobium sp.]|nr:xanthine dehydrogenase small subunit [Novosphingobium sp.]